MALRSQTAPSKNQVLGQVPPEGTSVAAQVNRKVELGMLPLSSGIGIARQIDSCLEKAGVKRSFMGASAFGTSLPVPRRLAAARPVSNLVDVQINSEDEHSAYGALTAAGWRPIDPTPYFSITFSKGEPRTLPTIPNQGFFVNSFYGTEVYLAVIPVPTVMLQNLGGRLHVVPLPALQTPGQVLAYKLIRGMDRDVMDILHLSSISRLKGIFDPEAVQLILDSQSGNSKGRALSSRLTAIVTSIPHFSRALGSDQKTIENNVEFLRGLIRS